MFNEDTTLGKKYVFDIRLTFRELYDNSRRILHAKGIDTSCIKIIANNNSDDSTPAISSGKSSNDFDNNGIKRIDLTCSICMDRFIDSLFLPCAHLSCCKNCAQKYEINEFFILFIFSISLSFSDAKRVLFAETK